MMNYEEVIYNWKEVTSIIIASTVLTTVIYGFTFII